MTRRRLKKIERLAGDISHPVAKLRFLQFTLHEPSWRSAKTRVLTAFIAAWLLFTVPKLSPAAHEVSVSPVAAPEAPVMVHLKAQEGIWQIEKTDRFETYSNGLRIDNQFSVANHRRSYLAFPIDRPQDLRGERRTVPAGIVFHTTESRQIPFQAGEDSALKRTSESVIAYVKRKKAYNFLIDRFGRVHRVVLESDAANHAGNSIWSDEKWLYVNLNESFLGISFEAQTQPGQTEATVNPAQMWSAGLLTAVLRQRYGIPASNCVTHAQVSVNAAGLRIGYHTDWASSFPFVDAGLPDNYTLPLPAVYLFGFGYDADFARRAGARLYQEAERSEEVLREHAAEASLDLPAYRKALQERYRRLVTLVRENRAEQMDHEDF